MKSRLNLGLALLVIASAAMVLALAIWPGQAKDSERKVMDQRQAAQTTSARVKKPSSNASEAETVLRRFGNPPAEGDRPGLDGPKMQTKQIKMH